MRDDAFNTLWTSVDTYLEAHTLEPDSAINESLRSIEREGLPAIAVSRTQAKLLALFVRLLGARRVLEIGTLAGTSAIAMARELPADGRLISLEFEPRHAEIARRNLATAGLRAAVEVRVGAALDLLPTLEAEASPQFDFTFIDADKKNNSLYLDWGIRLSRPGGVVVVDNVVREGRVLDAKSTDESVIGTRALFDRIAALVAIGRVSSTAIQTVGSKGYDGLAIVVVK